METLSPPPKDFRFLKGWLTSEEMEEMCIRNHISRSQANNILAGRSKNWRFIESMIDKAKIRMGEVEKVKQMEKHLYDFQTH